MAPATNTVQRLSQSVSKAVFLVLKCRMKYVKFCESVVTMTVFLPFCFRFFLYLNSGLPFSLLIPFPVRVPV